MMAGRSFTTDRASGIYLTNLMPNECPRFQTTWPRRPATALREKASRTLPASALESSDTVIFAPVDDML